MHAGPLGRHAHNLSDEASDGRYRSDLVTTARTKPAATRAFVVDGARVATGAAPAFDDRFPDVPAADPDHRLPRDLPGTVLDLSFDAEQGANALYRALQFQLPPLARRILDGGSAVGDFCAHRGFFQSADRTHHRASGQQSAGERPAQMARHAAGAMGHSAGALVARLVVAVRSDTFGIQLRLVGAWLSRGGLAK